MKSTQALDVQTEVRGDVPAAMTGLAVAKVRSLLRIASEPVLFARVRLTVAADPAVAEPAIVQVNLDFNGRPLRVQATAVTVREAVDRMCDRLRVRLERAARNWAAVGGGKPVPMPHEWRHESIPSPRLSYFPRPVTERAIVRHKSYTPVRQTPQEAAAELEMLDYDFYLFTERDSRQDSVIYRDGDGYRLAQVRPQPGRVGQLGGSITVSERPAPRLAPRAAADRLEALGQPFLFFVDDETGHGSVIYHRYDGHYGLITPASGSGGR